MRYLAILLFLSFRLIAFSQEVVFSIGTKEPLEVVLTDPSNVPNFYPSPSENWGSNPDQFASFPGGMAVLNKYFKENGKTDYDANVTGGQIFIECLINEEGLAEKIQIVRDFNNLKCNQEAIRLVQGMPRWIPALENDKKVNSKIILPVLVEVE